MALCPSCRTRSAKRWCPALRVDICAICCGSKRGVEIACPSDCPYLATARTHPPATVRRQQERDVAVLGPFMQGLTHVEQQLFLLLLTSIGRGRPDPLHPMRDGDVVDATGAVAATLETAAKGVIYEHRATSMPAQRLATDLQTLLDEIGKHQTAPQGAGIVDSGATNGLGPSAFQAAAALALRRVEDLAKHGAEHLPGGDRAVLELAGRIGRQFGASQPPGAAETAADAGEKPSTLILP
jgi:hypothetical protein